jgi:Ca2+-binding EF-hand superfamily protein
MVAKLSSPTYDSDQIQSVIEYAKELGHNLSEEEALNVLKQADLNHDGNVDVNETIQYLKNQDLISKA